MSQAPSPANLPAKRVEPLTPLVLVKHRMDAMLAALPANPQAQMRFRQAAIGVCMNPLLAGCTPESVYKTVYACARLGLVPDPVLHHVAVVPFTNKGVREATLMIEYRGLVELAKRADPGLYLKVGTVYANDDYVLEEGLVDQFRITKHHWEKGLAAGPARFSYCISRQTGGQAMLKVVSKQEGEQIARASKQGYGQGSIWFNHEDRMREKTALRRSANLWQLDPNKAESGQLREALDVDERTEELGEPPEAVDVTAEGEQPQAPQTAQPEQEPAGTQMGEQLQAEAEGLPVQPPAGTARIGSTEPAKRGRPRKANGAPPAPANAVAPAAPDASFAPDHPGEGSEPAAPQTPATPPQPAPQQEAKAPAATPPPTTAGTPGSGGAAGGGGAKAAITPELKGIIEAFKLAQSQRGLTPTRESNAKLFAAVTGQANDALLTAYVIGHPEQYPAWTAAVQALTLEQIQQAVR